MKTLKQHFGTVTSSFFILLFCYAAISKIIDFENFQVQLAQSPLTNAYSVSISYAVIAVELLIVSLLSSSKLRLPGLHASFTLMVFFTVYIYVILNYSDNIPCSCGGVLEELGWSEHLIFNILCAAAALAAIISNSETGKNILLPLVVAEIAIPALMLAISFYPVVMQNQDVFVRKVVDPFDSEMQVIELPKSSYYIAGNFQDTVFLADSKTPLLLTTIDPAFGRLKIDTLKLDDYNLKFRSVNINVLYPYFSLTDGKVPAIFEGELPSFSARKTDIGNLYFSKIVLMNSNQYVFRAVVTRSKQSELGVLNTLQKSHSINPKVLESQIDGIFDTDGNITFDRERKKIFYTYLYRNEIVFTDPDLNHIERFNTIDSFSGDDIKVRKLSTGQTKLVKTPQQVNTYQSVWGNDLYNISKIRGKNESFKDFSKKIVIDIYDTNSKKYKYSYYVKNDNKSSVKGILRTKKYFYVLSSDHITRYAFK